MSVLERRVRYATRRAHEETERPLASSSITTQTPSLRRARRLCPRPVVIQPKQFDHIRDVGAVADKTTDPARFRVNVVRLGAAGGDELVANEQREWQVRETVPVKMPELPPPYSELSAAKAVP